MAIAKVTRMRELELLPKKLREIPNLQEMNFKYEIPEWEKIQTKDQSMPAEHNDNLIYEMIDFLASETIVPLSNDLLKYV